jgi:hypothetical protein
VLAQRALRGLHGHLARAAGMQTPASESGTRSARAYRTGSAAHYASRRVRARARAAAARPRARCEAPRARLPRASPPLAPAQPRERIRAPHAPW